MMLGKIHIEKNTVQETLIVPLYGRKMCSEKFLELYTDVFAKNLCERLDYDFFELEKKKNSYDKKEAVMYSLSYPTILYGTK